MASSSNHSLLLSANTRPKTNPAHSAHKQSRIRHSDDYITRRAANPRTGLITPSECSFAATPMTPPVPVVFGPGTPRSPAEMLELARIERRSAGAPCASPRSLPPGLPTTGSTQHTGAGRGPQRPVQRPVACPVSHVGVIDQHGSDLTGRIWGPPIIRPKLRRTRAVEVLPEELRGCGVECRDFGSYADSTHETASTGAESAGFICEDAPSCSRPPAGRSNVGVQYRQSPFAPRTGSSYDQLHNRRVAMQNTAISAQRGPLALGARGPGQPAVSKCRHVSSAVDLSTKAINDQTPRTTTIARKPVSSRSSQIGVREEQNCGVGAEMQRADSDPNVRPVDACPSVRHQHGQNPGLENIRTSEVDLDTDRGSTFSDSPSMTISSASSDEDLPGYRVAISLYRIVIQAFRCAMEALAETRLSHLRTFRNRSESREARIQNLFCFFSSAARLMFCLYLLLCGWQMFFVIVDVIKFFARPGKLIAGAAVWLLSFA